MASSDRKASIPVAQLQAAIRLLYPSEMTPTAKRILELIAGVPEEEE